jgi:hypothetical protein
MALAPSWAAESDVDAESSVASTPVLASAAIVPSTMEDVASDWEAASGPPASELALPHEHGAYVPSL